MKGFFLGKIAYQSKRDYVDNCDKCSKYFIKKEKKSKKESHVLAAH